MINKTLYSAQEFALIESKTRINLVYNFKAELELLKQGKRAKLSGKQAKKLKTYGLIQQTTDRFRGQILVLTTLGKTLLEAI